MQKSNSVKIANNNNSAGQLGLRSTVVIPNNSSFNQTRSRMIKKPARFVEKIDEIGDKNTKRKKAKIKVKANTVHQKIKAGKYSVPVERELDMIDEHTVSEITEGNLAAVDHINHDGVELSVNGSDLDEFSDDEQPENRNSGHEPGEILSSDEEQHQVDDVNDKFVNRNENRSANKTTENAGPVVRTTNKFAKFRQLKNDPEFNEFLDELLDKKLSDSGMDNAKRNSKKGNQMQETRRTNLIKSPSDTTLYSPALRKAHTNQDKYDNIPVDMNKSVNVNMGNDSNLSDTINPIDGISRFVDNMRIQSEVGTSSAAARHSGPPVNTVNRRHNQDVRIVEEDENRPSTSRGGGTNSGDLPDSERTTDQLLLQAEKFKACVEAPKGMNNGNSLLMPYDYDRLRDRFITDEGLGPIDREIMFLRNFDQDDEFFHITSQIDPGMKNRIERGEYIELERLLSKDRFSGGMREDLNKQLFQLISQGTNSYLTTPDHRNGGKIHSIKKWDQAFRVYAAIYTQANPGRSGEIWQYVYIIHTAAASNPWENVAHYDITFRELMASKPWRSWGKIYAQGWNMAFNNNNLSGHGHNTNYGSMNGQGSSNSNRGNQNNNSQSNSWKDDCCWRYNKNKCTRTSNECRYDHRCTHCAGWYHSYNNCRKRLNRGNGGNGGKPNNWSNNTKPSTSPKKQVNNVKNDKNDTKSN